MLDILRETRLTDCKPVSTPIVPGQRLTHADGELLPDATLYRRLVGKLLYLTTTRPDISFAVQQLSQFIDCPTNKHLIAAHRVLRYLIQAFTDADWAACSETRRSVTEFCIYLGGALVS